MGITDSYNNEKVIYTSKKIDLPYAEVGSEMLTFGGGEFTLNYKLHRVSNGWKVYDEVVENISLVNIYRSQFSRVINKSSYDKLVSAIARASRQDNEVWDEIEKEDRDNSAKDDGFPGGLSL